MYNVVECENDLMLYNILLKFRIIYDTYLIIVKLETVGQQMSYY